MKILIHLENLHRGGVDTFVVNLVKYWPSKKDKFILISNYNHPSNKFFLENIRPQDDLVEYKIPFFTDVVDKLPNFLKTFFVKIIIKISLIPIQFFLLRKIFINLKADALIVANGGYPGGETSRFANIIWKMLNRKNNIHNINNLAVIPNNFLEKMYEYLIDKILIHSVDKFVCVSKTSEKYLKKRNSFRLLNNILYIYYGISYDKNHSEFNIREKLGLNLNSKICLVLATYEERKGHKFLINSFKEVLKDVEDVHLVFVGYKSKSDQKYFEELNFFRKNINEIHFLDFIPNASRLIKQCNVLLLGSQEFESFGLVALEAMLCKKPVIATNLECFEEVIGNQSCGLIVDKEDYKKYAKAIKRILLDHSLSQKISGNGYKRAKDIFTPSKMAMHYSKLSKN